MCQALWMAPKNTPSHIVVTQGNTDSHTHVHMHTFMQRSKHEPSTHFHRRTNVSSGETDTLLHGFTRDTYTNKCLPNMCTHTHKHKYTSCFSPEARKSTFTLVSPSAACPRPATRWCQSLTLQCSLRAGLGTRQRVPEKEIVLVRGGRGSRIPPAAPSFLPAQVGSREFVKSSYSPIRMRVPVAELYSIKQTPV